MGALVKDKGDASVPAGLQHRVPQPTSVHTMLPAGQITGTVRILWRGANLTAVYTPPATKPAEWRNGDSSFQNLVICEILL